MNSKLVGIVVAAIVLVGVAWFMSTRGGGASGVERSAFLSTLKEDLSKVTRIEVVRGDESVALERSGEDWLLASAGGYPAKVDGVRSIMTGLVGLEIDEPLTAKRERHADIGLAWPDEKKQAALIRLLDANANAMHEVVLGEEKFSPKSQYVRKLAEDQTYRCRGGITIDTSVRGFAETEIVSLKADDLESIGYDVLLLSRGDDGNWKAEFAPTPVDESTWPEEQRKAAAQTFPGWISRLDFDNVRRREREGAQWTADPAYSITYFAKKATLSIEGMKEGSAVWLRLSAKAVAAPEATPEPAPPAEAETDPATPELKPADPAPFDWEAWNARVSAWEFQLPEWKASSITRIREAKPAAAAPPTPVPSLPVGP
jgi:succinate dehydrogenase flavin-adding protein (antitoxin of CptAB toxin-antitoxin module)